MTHDQTHPSRRRVLQTLVGAGSLLAVHGVASAEATPILRAAPPGLRQITAQAVTTEALRLTLYHSALQGAGFQITAEAADQLRAMIDSHRHHLTRLVVPGGAAPAPYYYFPAAVEGDARCFVDTAQQLESVSTTLYLTATRDYAAVGQAGLAETAALLAASAAQHQIRLAQMAGLVGLSLHRAAPRAQTLTAVAAALHPFLSQSTGQHLRLACPTVA